MCILYTHIKLIIFYETLEALGSATVTCIHVQRLFPSESIVEERNANTLNTDDLVRKREERLDKAEQREDRPADEINRARSLLSV